MDIKAGIGAEILDSEAYDKLLDMGFLKAPASTRYHGNYEGGLFDHSYEVAQELLAATCNNRLKWQRPESPWIVGMFHDLCKVDAYELKNSDPPEYSHANTILRGHGEKSVMIASTLLRLTEEEVYCIRFHMGAFNHEEMNEYSRAVEKFPNVLWTHTADMIASKLIGV
jgi:23S rRNA maturation-related 3'-5' exoribonuclease YhaM